MARFDPSKRRTLKSPVGKEKFVFYRYKTVFLLKLFLSLFMEFLLPFTLIIFATHIFLYTVFVLIISIGHNITVDQIEKIIQYVLSRYSFFHSAISIIPLIFFVFYRLIIEFCTYTYHDFLRQKERELLKKTR